MQKNLLKSAIISSLLLLGPAVPVIAVADFNSHFSAGENAFASQNFVVAAENYAEALKYVPEDLRSRFRYGQALFSLNRFSESHSQFQAVLQNSPSNIIARVYLAENLVRLNKAAEAKVQLEWILKVQPGHQRALQLLAETNAQAPAARSSAAIKGQSPKNPRPVKVVANVVDGGNKKAVSQVKAQPKPQKAPPATQPSSEAFAPAPFIAGQQNPARTANKVAAFPPAASQVQGFSTDSYLAMAGNSFLVNLEQARFHLEQGDSRAAAASLIKADQLAREGKDSRRFLEVQILNSLVLLYNRDFTGFGQHLMQLKPIMSADSYQSFLDIYNQGAALKDSVDQARLVAGIAMGAGHHAVAARLLQEAYAKLPNDLLIGSMLADAQIQSLNYKGAEATLAQLARNDAGNGEVWFNLARFYLTADYRPEQVKTYALHAAKLRPDDSRNAILLALLDYSQGNMAAGIERINDLLPGLKDPALKNICTRIISDGKSAGSAKVDFVGVLALPGARHAAKSSYRMLGEDYLKQGSYFTAIKYFKAADDVAEIGRSWLGLASALHTSGETSLAATTAGYGIKALHHELAANPGNSRANLYLALYHYERGDKVAARQAIERGLASQSCERSTRQRLTAVLNAISSVN